MTFTATRLEEAATALLVHGVIAGVGVLLGLLLAARVAARSRFLVGGTVAVAGGADLLPRGYALRWATAAMTGLFHDHQLGARSYEGERPLWVELSRTVAPVLMLLTVTSAVVLTLVARRRGARALSG